MFNNDLWRFNLLFRVVTKDLVALKYCFGSFWMCSLFREVLES